MSLVLNVEILGEFKKLTEATQGSQKSLGGLEDNAKKISKGINTALGAIGIGFSLNFLVDQFKESTKAAIEDQKSKVLLSKALEDNLGLTDRQVDSIESYISKTQIATSITDDRLRPAFAKLSIATKDTNEAMRLMNIAVDVAAGTGKGLDTVVQAMSRSLAGSNGALGRLVPSVKDAIDPMAELEKMFAGAAEAAANTDPYARLQILFGEMQEQIGAALLPILEDFSKWLATPEGQEKIQGLVDGIVDMTETFADFLTYLDKEVMPGIETLTGEKGIGAVITAVTNLVVGLGVLKIAMAVFSSGNPALAGALAGLALLAGAMFTVYQNTKLASDEMEEFQRLQGIQRATSNPFSTPEQIAAATYRGILDVGRTPARTPGRASGTVQVPLGNTTINVNLNRATVNGSQLVDEINNTLKNRGLNAKALK